MQCRKQITGRPLTSSAFKGSIESMSRWGSDDTSFVTGRLVAVEAAEVRWQKGT